MDGQRDVPALTTEGHAALVAHDANYLTGQAVAAGVPVTVTVDRTVTPCVVTLVGVRDDGSIVAERRTYAAPAGPSGLRVQDYVDGAAAVGRPVPMKPSEGLDWLGLRGGVPQFAESYAATFRAANPAHEDAAALCLPASSAHLLAAGTAAIADMLDPEALDALACIGTFDHAAYEFYAMAEGPRREARLQAASAYPLFAAEIVRQPAVKFAIDGRRPLQDKLERAFGVDQEGRFYLTRPLMKRFQGLTQPDNGIDVDVLVRTLSQVPPDWFPRDDAEWDAFCDLADEGFRHFGPAVGERADKLCPSAAGKWAATRARIAKAAASTFPPDDLDEEERRSWRPVGDESRRGLRSAFDGAMDMVHAFRDLVLLPVAGSACMDDIPLSGAAMVLATETAGRILFGGKSLVATMESQRHWHTQAHAVLAAREQLPGEEGEEDTDGIDVASDGWAPLCDQWLAPNGVSIEPLTDPREITAEGKGLSHCVGGYSAQCKAGTSHIVAFRRYELGGQMRRLSTAEFTTPPEGSSELHCRQHRGRGNGTPPAAASEAYAWFTREVAMGRIPLNRDGMMSYRARTPRASDDIQQRAGYDRKDLVVVDRCLAAWEEWLPKRLRGMGHDALRESAELQALVEAVAPTYRMAAAL